MCACVCVREIPFFFFKERRPTSLHPGTDRSILLAVQTRGRVFGIVTIFYRFLRHLSNRVGRFGSKPGQDFSLRATPGYATVPRISIMTLKIPYIIQVALLFKRQFNHV